MPLSSVSHLLHWCLHATATRRWYATLLVCLWPVLWSSSLLAAEWITVRGRLEPVSDADETVEKSFVLHALISEEDGGNELIWTLEESGAGSWTWLDHAGKLQWDVRGTLSAGSVSPALRYDSGDVRGNVPLTLVLPQPTTPLAIGATWEHEGLAYTVVESARVAEQTAWVVNVRNNFGEKRTVLATVPAGLIVDLQETVFLGQGGRYRLRYQVSERRPLSAQAWRKAQEEFTSIDQLRQRIDWRPREVGRVWTDEQLEILKEAMPSVRNQLETETLVNFVRVAAEESRLERGRAGALDAMRRRALDLALPGFQFEPVGNQGLTREDLEGVVTVLHFWDYKDAPLREPYGQVGYLDFLSRKYDSQGLRVVGVVVSGDLGVPQERRQSALSARRFANFMNLAYPLFVDQGGLLGRVGDPRLCDASLPLFVTVGRDGKIVHYHAGHYPVDNNRGLVELEGVIQTALQMGE